MELFNATGVIGGLVVGLDGITGNPYWSVMLLIILLLVALLAVGIGGPWSAIIMLPLFLTLWAYDASFQLIGGLVLIYLGLVIAKQWFFG